MTNSAENHTLWGRTYVYSPYKGVPPPAPFRVANNSCGTNTKTISAKHIYLFYEKPTEIHIRVTYIPNRIRT